MQDPTEKLNNELVDVPASLTINYIGFDVNIAPMDDPNFRKALIHAVDKELIADQIFAGLVEPAYGVLPPGFPAYNENLEGLGFDPELARLLLEQSRYADPSTRPRIVITIPGSGGSKGLTTEVISDMWRQNLGVETEIQQVEFETFQKDFNSRYLALYTYEWFPDYLSPDQLLELFFHSHGLKNAGSYSNHDVDSLLDKARSEINVANRYRFYQDAEQLIVDDAALMPLWFDTTGLALVKPWVKGLTFPQTFKPRFGQVYIDQ